MSSSPSAPAAASPFTYPMFRGLWLATLVSNLGGLIQGVAAGWMMTQISTSHALVALVQASTTLPIMIFSLAAGALADSFDRRRIMLAALAFMLGVSFALAAVAYAGLMTPWLLLAFTFLIGCGVALYNPSWQASVGDIVPRAALPQAVLLNSVGFNLMRSIGPAIGGAIVAAAGVAVAFAANALSYVALIVALARWQPAKSGSALPAEPFVRAVATGVRYVTMSPNLMRVMLRGALFGAGAVSILALLPVVVRERIGGGAIVYGVLLGAFGAGAIAGVFASRRLREGASNETVVRAAFLGFALSAVGLGLSGSAALSAAVLLVSGASWVIALSLFNVTVQLSTPRWVVGRALSLYQMATFGGMAAGAWIWGVVAEALGSDSALFASAALLLAGGAVGLVLPLPEFEALNLDPADRFSEPPLRLDLTARSGPIMVMVDYRIEQVDVPAFLALMAERRRIRIRDGARQWALLRDLEHPDVWSESYHVPTWVDYVRHNQRRTQGDVAVTDRLRALHRGDAPPEVHRMIERQTVTTADNMPLKAAIAEPHV